MGVSRAEKRYSVIIKPTRLAGGTEPGMSRRKGRIKGLFDKPSGAKDEVFGLFRHFVLTQ